MRYSFKNPDTGEIEVTEDLEHYGTVLDWEQVATGEADPEPDAVLVDGSWVVPLDVRKARKRAEVNELRDLHQNDTAMTPVGWVDVDEQSKTKINGLVSMATLAKGAGQPFQVNFTKADDSRVTLDADGIIGLGMSVGQHIMACHYHASALKDAIAAATDDQELAAIDILANWP
jgi:hypothetical protein